MSKKLLVIGFVWPEPKSSAAGSRMMQVLEAFQNYGYHITFATTAAKTENAEDLSVLGIDEVKIELNSASFDDFISELHPHTVLFDRFMTEEQFGWRVAKHCPNAIRILDTEDLHCLRKGRQQAFLDAKPFDESYLFNDTAKREIASIYRCDLSLIISEFEMDLLINTFKIPENLLCYLPFMVGISDKELPDFESRNNFITVGTFLHEPNYRAALFLKNNIWPLIKQQLPKAELHIYGAYASQKVLQLHDEKSGFLIKGFVEDIAAEMQNARVCLAPLQFGAGLKGKLIDAMLNGTPSVMTSIAAEGMFGQLQPSGFVSNDAEEFAQLAVKLYTDSKVWREKQEQGLSVLKLRFNKLEHQNLFGERLAALANNLKAHRLQNFTGAMLQHHTLQSTVYLAKWIEAKNKHNA